MTSPPLLRVGADPLSLCYAVIYVPRLGAVGGDNLRKSVNHPAAASVNKGVRHGATVLNSAGDVTE
jgi:hypothetical protein